MGKRRELSTAIIIHGIDDARAALDAAAALGRSVTLVSAPGAAGYAGAAWFLKVVSIAAAENPEARWEAVLDCADKPGHVLAALRQGAKAVRYTGPKKTARKLADIAEQSGARLETGRLDAFDLRSEADPGVACRAWLDRRPRGARSRG